MQDFIKASLDYIEQNLKTEISAGELAQMAGYSAGHFCRIFARTMDATVAAYISKRRLDHVLVEISSGRKAIDVVPEYGFDTYAGFYKAFVKMYGCSPKNYLNNHGSTKKEVLFMHSTNEIRNILGHWDIETGLDIEDVTHVEWETKAPSEWKTWQIGNDYYLKTNERSKMIRNIKIAKALTKQGLASEFLPLPTRQGTDYLEGENIFLLTRKIGEAPNQRPLSDDEIGRLENNALRGQNAIALGRAIARLHKALKSVQDDIEPYEGDLYAQGADTIPLVKEHIPGIGADFFTDYVENFGRLCGKLPRQLIHGNLCGDTAVYEGGEVVCFKGFEAYNLSFQRIYDITWGAGEINAGPSIEGYLQTLTEMLKGYDSISPLTTEEKQSVYYCICATYLKGYAYYSQTDEARAVMARSDRALVYLAGNKEQFMGLL